MKTLTKIILTVWLIAFVNANAEYSIPLTVETTGGDELTNLQFGWNEEATQGIDTELGEFALPIMELPGGAFYGYFIVTEPDTEDQNGSYKDYKPIENGTNEIQFELRTAKRDLNELMTVSWPKLLTTKLDSAFFEDIFPEVEIFKFNMMETQEAVIENPDNRKFLIRLYFKVTGLEDNTQNEEPEIKVYPNPVSDILNVESKNSIKTTEIYNYVGNKIAVKSVNDNIDVSELPTGIYFLQVFYHNGKSDRVMFQKIN
jgi:hypothetical protein